MKQKLIDTRKRIIFLLVLAVITVTICAMIWNHFDKLSERQKLSQIDATQSSAVIKVDGDSTTKVKEYHPSAPSAQEVRTNADIQIMDDFYKRIGKDTDVRNTYKAYSDDELKEMAHKGDFIAADTLAFNYFDRMQLDEAYAMAELGIILGSYQSLSLASYRHSPHPGEDDDEATREQNKLRLMEYLSYVQLMEMRGGGDILTTEILRNTVLKSFETAYGEKEPLTEESYIAIKKGVQELYNYYQAKRHELGLGDFDNTVPQAVTNYFHGQ